MLVQRLDSRAASFDAQLAALTARPDDRDPALAQQVADIITAVRERGDAALLALTAKFDGREVGDIGQLLLGREAMQVALESLPDEQRDALQSAAQRIRTYHEHQVAESWAYRDAHGNQLGQRVTPLHRVGVYVPGGKASYPSSVLMNAIPARVAGVAEVVMVVPAPGGELNPLVLGAAAVAGVDRVITAGGAQAIAALA